MSSQPTGQAGVPDYKMPEIIMVPSKAMSFS